MQVFSKSIIGFIFLISSLFKQNVDDLVSGNNNFLDVANWNI